MSGKSKNIGILMLLPMVAAFITACGGGGEGGEGGEGGSAHNKGQDCLSCHNFSLAATVYQNAGNGTPCNGALHVQFLDSTTKAVVIDSTNLADVTSSGNFYIRREPITPGSYDMRIISGNGTVLAQSALPHTFTSGYKIGNAADMNNRYSCNACHKNPPLNGATGSLFTNVNKCQ